MSEIDKDNLNRKLAEWAGFTSETKEYEASFSDGIDGDVFTTTVWIDPEGEIYGDLDLTESIDACFKWLVSLIIDKQEDELYKIAFTYNHPNGGITCDITTESRLYQAQGATLALALCLTIEKLIDSGE